MSRPRDVAETFFPSGTVMLFQQTASPTGWTKGTTHTDKALRLTTGTVGTGGDVAFETAFAPVTPTITMTNADHQLAIAEIPDHSHVQCVYGGSGQNPVAIIGGGSTPGCVGYSQPSNGAGGSGVHSHSNTAASNEIDLNVSFVDVIIATKD